MRFLQPQYLKLFLLLAALFPLWLCFLYIKHKTRVSLGHSRPLRKISRLSPLWHDFGRYLLLNLVLAGLIVALAHPQRIREKRVTQPKRLDIVFLLDTSPSMRAQDVPPSRLERALEVIGSFAHKKLSDDRVALVSFAGASLILSYLTEDPNNILYYLDYLRSDTAPSYGTNIGRALKNGLTVITKELEVRPQAARYRRVFVLVSDGEDHGKELESALRDIKRSGIKVHTIGIGSKEGAPIPIAKENGAVLYLEDEQGVKIMSRFDEGTLRQVAEESGGNAYRTFTGHDLERIIAEIVLKERAVEGLKKVVDYEDLYHPFLLAALGAFFVAVLF
ncbi:MAG: VWA domain-containing protein [Deltaproteobacteria bacterium]|nr:VWA domain-containing protein [Deltaproteobacteria bacterium]